jgi:hypothetical protein
VFALRGAHIRFGINLKFWFLYLFLFAECAPLNYIANMSSLTNEQLMAWKLNNSKDLSLSVIIEAQVWIERNISAP